VFVRKVRNGGATRFWLDVWAGREPLCVTFPHLFKVPLQPNFSVMDMGDSVNDTWLWRLTWRRSFFAWEVELFMKLLETIDSVPITKKDDLWTCSIYGDFLQLVVYTNFSINVLSCLLCLGWVRLRQSLRGRIVELHRRLLFSLSKLFLVALQHVLILLGEVFYKVYVWSG
jgi:hypothetical protein